MRSGDRPALTALVLVVALQLVVFARASFLPFVDLPQHLAAAAILARHDDPGVAARFTFDLFPQVDVLYLFASAAALEWLPEDAAVRLLLAVYLAALAASLASLCRALGTSAWAAVAAMLFAVHFGVWYGFMSYTLGLPLVLWLVARLCRTERPGGSTVALDAAIWLAILLGHVLLFCFALVAAALWLVLGDGRRHWPRLGSALPAGILLLLWIGHTGGAGAGMAWFLFDDLGKRLGRFGWSSIVVTDSGRVEWSVVVLVAVVAVWLWLRGERDRARRWPRALALAALLGYFVLPASIHSRNLGGHALYLCYPRFLVFAPLLFLPTLTWPRQAGSRRVLAVLLLSAHLALALTWSRALDAVAAEAAGLAPALARLPPGSAVRALIYQAQPGAIRFDSFMHVGVYHQARSLGDVSGSFLLFPYFPVRYRKLPHPVLSRLETDPRYFLAEGYDYLLVREARAWQRRFPAEAVFPAVYRDHDFTVRQRPAVPVSTGPGP